MADTSPGKVQVLRQMFAQKNEPVMGCIKPGVNSNRPWNRSSASEDAGSEEKNRNSPVSVTATQAMLRAIQTTDYKKPVGNGPCETTRKVFIKPSIGPKPGSFSQARTFSSNAFNIPNNLHVQKNKRLSQRSYSESNNANKTETVASFMFGSVHKQNIEDSNNDEPRYRPLPTSKPSVNGTNKSSIHELSNSGDNMKPKNSTNIADIKSHLNLINSDNYICKSRNNVKRKEMPPKYKLGPPPLKPVKPPNMKLPEQFCNRNISAKCHAFVNQDSQENKPSLPPKRDHSLPQKPPYPCPPRPSASPPRPPSQKSSASNQSSCNTSPSQRPKTLLEEIEQIYADAVSEDSFTKIPEYTEEEELGPDELYGDTITEDYGPPVNKSPYSSKPKHLQSSSSSPQSLYLEPVTRNNFESTYYDDTVDPCSDGEMYEVMPTHENPEDDHYSNNPKEIEKTKREEEKRIRKEQKEKLKKEKELEKLKKKFSLTGGETPIDSGLVKVDCKGGRLDLNVKKGENVDILRIEGNPIGKWLVRNKKGKYGYVELTNIEVDPNSVKSVMTVKRSSVISTSEELYNEAYSEQEGIYEMTY